jgi:hypothetical protein
MILVSSEELSRWARSSPFHCAATSTSSATVSAVSRIDRRRTRVSFTRISARRQPAERGEASGSSAMMRALVAPEPVSLRFRPVAAATDAERRNRVDHAHFVAGMMSVMSRRADAREDKVRRAEGIAGATARPDSVHRLLGA